MTKPLRLKDNIEGKDLTFGPLIKNDNCYITEILYKKDFLYYQIDGNQLKIDKETNKAFCIINQYENIFDVESIIRKKLAEVSNQMFKRGFTEEILIKMQKPSFSEGLSIYSHTEVFDMDGCRFVDYTSGNCDIIIVCKNACFEQSNWKLTWEIRQIRQKRKVSPSFMFLDQHDEQHEQDEQQEELTEHTDYTFTPKLEIE